jgi:hypothetical protein
MCTVHVVKARKERFASFTGVFLQSFPRNDWMPQHLWPVPTLRCGVAHTLQWLRFSLTGVNYHSQVFYIRGGWKVPGPDGQLLIPILIGGLRSEG